jgi:hypothetical protein
VVRSQDSAVASRDLREKGARIALAHVALPYEDGAQVDGLGHALLDHDALANLVLSRETTRDGDLAEVDLSL